MTTEQDFGCMLLQARAAGKHAVAMLAEQHLPLVAALVKRFPWNGREREELYQQGCVGLMKALVRYDPDYGTAFSTYAAAMILGEMRMLARHDAPLHIPRHEREQRFRVRRSEKMLRTALGREPTIQELAAVLRMDPAELTLVMEQIQVVSLDQQTQSGHHSFHDLLSADDHWMDRLMLRDMISRLSKDDQKLLLLRYRMGKTQTETAAVLGISQVQVSRRESAIKASLRKNWNSE